MKYKKINPIFTPYELKKNIATDILDKAFIEKSRSTAKNIFLKKDKKLAIVMGPCSIHDEKASIEYGLKFKELSDKVSKKIFLIMRAHFSKPRSALGWKGFMHDPKLNNSNHLNTGIKATRSLLVKLTQLKIPLACEFLDINTYLYFEDLITWGFIGARTATSQPHRELASSFSFPIGFKNSLDGDINITIDSIKTSNHPHNLITIDDDGKIAALETFGNPFSHIVLRGSKSETNFDEKNISNVINLLKEKNLFQSIMIDCSHDNAKKSLTNLKKCFQDVLTQAIYNNAIVGMMFESNLKEGSQTLKNPYSLNYGVSITDPCLSWEDSEKLILESYELLSSTVRCAV